MFLTHFVTFGIFEVYLGTLHKLNIVVFNLCYNLMGIFSELLTAANVNIYRNWLQQMMIYAFLNLCPRLNRNDIGKFIKKRRSRTCRLEVRNSNANTGADAQDGDNDDADTPSRGRRSRLGGRCRPRGQRSRRRRNRRAEVVWIR